MTETNIHKERKVKNLLLFGLLMLFVVFVFAITIIKLQIRPQGNTAENPLSQIEPTKSNEEE